MGFPDRIERTNGAGAPAGHGVGGAHYRRGAERVVGQQAAIDLRPGGTAWMKWDNGHTANLPGLSALRWLV